MALSLSSSACEDDIDEACVIAGAGGLADMAEPSASSSSVIMSYSLNVLTSDVSWVYTRKFNITPEILQFCLRDQQEKQERAREREGGGRER